MNKKEENKPPNKKLVLHFDVNKTVILEDKAKGLSKEAHLYQILARQAWGQLEQKDAKSPIQWKLQHNHFTPVQPEKDLLNYKEYVDSQYPLKSSDEEPNVETRKTINASMKQSRMALYTGLVKPGGPGLKLKPEFDKIIKSITLPRLQREEDPNNNNNNSSEEEKIYDLLSDGKYYILPSFFRMMTTLKKAKREFAIVFRTFGSDLPAIIREMNSFSAGEHPCFNGRNNTMLVKFDGSKNNKNYKIKQPNTGLFYRNQSHDIEKCSLTLGTINRKDSHVDHEGESSVNIVSGTHAIHAMIKEILKESCALGLQDDYSSWDFYDQKVHCSKPMIIDQSDYLTQHIFFDDNITEDEECIVDVRDVVTGEQLPISSTLNKYIARVETIDAIKNPDYFVKLIELCERNRAEDIERTERPQLFPTVVEEVVSATGEVQQVQQTQQKSEFQILMESPSDVYLRSTILPLLSTGLRICDTERPQDPISFLASYILKNKEKVRIPVPPPVEPAEANPAGAGGEDEQQQDVGQLQSDPVAAQK